MSRSSRPSKPPPAEARALYLHLPFCRAKCAYCDFNSYPGREELFEPYTAALIEEMRRAAPAAGRLDSVYLGGGTPTALPLPLLEQILRALFALFEVASGAELSLEANPGTVDERSLAALRAAGANRLSLGVQSLDGGALRRLGRIHTAAQAAEAAAAARRAGFDNLSLDLIYGLPAPAAWRRTLEAALALAPDHLSCYALSVEEGTPLAAAIARGALPEPDPDRAAREYEWAEARLAAAGYRHYEISNWARPGRECRHNLVYWRNQPYLGLGAGAHSWDGACRRSNVAAPDVYVARLQAGRSPVEAEEAIGPALHMGETMMLGLRLLEEGVAFEPFRRRFGVDLRAHYAAALAETTRLGLVEADGARVRLTPRGRLLGNQAFMRFLPDEEEP